MKYDSDMRQQFFDIHEQKNGSKMLIISAVHIKTVMTVEINWIQKSRKLIKRAFMNTSNRAAQKIKISLKTLVHQILFVFWYMFNK